MNYANSSLLAGGWLVRAERIWSQPRFFLPRFFHRLEKNEDTDQTWKKYFSATIKVKRLNHFFIKSIKEKSTFLKFILVFL